MKRLLGRIVHRSWGEDFTRNEFCLIVRDSAKSVLLAPLRTVWGKSPVMYSGTTPILAGEVPITPPGKPERLANHPRAFRATKRCSHDGNLSFHAGNKEFILWDGEPKDGDRLRRTTSCSP